MQTKGYLKADDIYMSGIFGRGIYQWNKRLTPDPLAGAPFSPLVTNIITEEAFFAKRFDSTLLTLQRYQRHILNPPDRTVILWPCDLLECPGSLLEQCGLFVAQKYTGFQSAQCGEKEEGLLLFPWEDHSQMVNGIQWLRQAGRQNWRNPIIRDMAVQLVQAIERLNRSGYVYGDFHLSRFFFQEDGSVFLNYSNLIYAFNDLDLPYPPISSPAPGEYPIEFAEPAVVQGKQKTLDFHSQNYSLCALLFFLLLGRYPYDGRFLSGCMDTDSQSHYAKFRLYHTMPVFIFDPTDRQNSLGAFIEEQRTTELWHELPESLKELFILTLNERNATRAVQAANPAPVTWLKCFQELGWL